MPAKRKCAAPKRPPARAKQRVPADWDLRSDETESVAGSEDEKDAKKRYNRRLKKTETGAVAPVRLQKGSVLYNEVFK